MYRGAVALPGSGLAGALLWHWLTAPLPASLPVERTASCPAIVPASCFKAVREHCLPLGPLLFAFAAGAACGAWLLWL
eukprot:4944943-Lingulodinium_polyedra.AAC.1